MHISTDPPVKRPPPPTPGARNASAGQGGATRHLRAMTAPAYFASARPVEIDPRDEDTIELELTPDQIRMLEESAKLAFARDSKERLRPTPRATTIRPPHVNASRAVAPIIVLPPVVRVTPARTALKAAATQGVPSVEMMPLPVSESAKRDALPLTNAGGTSQSSEPSATEAPSCTPARSHSSTATVSSRRARRSLLLLAIAISVPVIVTAAAIHLSATRPHTIQPRSDSASAVPRTPSPPATGTQALRPATDRAEPATPNLPVTFANPFDRSEIFEFPPDTTREKARDTVAQILTERARERQNRVKPVGKTSIDSGS